MSTHKGMIMDTSSDENLKREKRFLTTREAAQLLGITQQALRIRVCRREIPFRKWGRRTIFITREVENFIDRLPGLRASEMRRL